MTWEAAIRVCLGTLELDARVEGELRPIVLVGPNGSGKTTLLRAIAGAVPSATGLVRVSERVLLDSERAVSLGPEQRRVGYVPQGYGLFPHLSVRDNVIFGLETRSPRWPRSARHNAATRILSQLGCSELAARMPASLSGGEQQRVALARALVVEPDLLLLDEPLSALDAAARRTTRTFLVDRLTDLAKPAIVVTHDLRDVLALGAEVFVLEQGCIAQRGSPDDLRRHPATAFVAELFDVAWATG